MTLGIPGTMKTVYDRHPDYDDWRRPDHYPDIREPVFWEVYERSKPYSLLSIEAFYSLFTSTEYVARAGVPGDFVECGVYLGGSVLALSEFAAHHGIRDRGVHLFDTFDGFPQDLPPEKDYKGDPSPLRRVPNFHETTRAVVGRSAYPQHLFHWIEGDVRETLPTHTPDRIAILRLDTDDYTSTRAELEWLYPRLVPGGVLILDDYGYFEGARRATEEFFADKPRPCLQRVSLSVRICVKP